MRWTNQRTGFYYAQLVFMKPIRDLIGNNETLQLPSGTSCNNYRLVREKGGDGGRGE